MSRYKHILWYVPLVIILSCILYLCSSMVFITADYQQVVPEYEPPLQKSSGFLAQAVVSLNMEAAENPVLYQQELANWRIVNEDVQGIINIEDFDIHYPVLYSGDNKTYLRHDIEHNYDVAGCIFIDANYGNIYSPMKLIHGHNMSNGTMFGKLPSLLQEESLDDAPIVEYYDDLGLKQFKVIAIFSVNSEEESVIIGEYSTINDLLDLKQGYLDRSWVPVSEVPDSVEMLMLNTCWYGKTGHEHYLHCIIVTCRVK